MNRGSRRSPVGTSTLSSISDSSQELTDTAKAEAHIQPDSLDRQSFNAPQFRDHTTIKPSLIKMHQESPTHGRGILKPKPLPGSRSPYGTHEQPLWFPVSQDKPKDSHHSIHKESTEAVNQLRSVGDPPPPVSNTILAALTTEQTALPLTKRKRVSIDPHPTVDVVTRDTAPSPPPRVPSAFRMMPQRRIPVQEGCPTSRAAQLYKHLSQAPPMDRMINSSTARYAGTVPASSSEECATSERPAYSKRGRKTYEAMDGVASTFHTESPGSQCNIPSEKSERATSSDQDVPAYRMASSAAGHPSGSSFGMETSHAKQGNPDLRDRPQKSVAQKLLASMDQPPSVAVDRWSSRNDAALPPPGGQRLSHGGSERSNHSGRSYPSPQTRFLQSPEKSESAAPGSEQCAKRQAQTVHTTLMQKPSMPPLIHRGMLVSGQLGGTPPRRYQVSPPSTALSLKSCSLPFAALAIVVLAVLVIVAILALAVARFRASFLVEQHAVCDTQDCVEHARKLLLRLNTSADPCDGTRDADFHTYVCGGGGGHSSTWIAAQGPRTMTAIRRQGFELLMALGDPASLLLSKHSSTAALKALRALDACKTNRVNQTSGPLVDFMRERGLHWPATPVKSPALLRVLDILLDLAINWRVALWFDLSLAVYGPDGRHVVALGEPSHLLMYRMEQLSELDEDGYAEAVRLVASFLAGGTVKFSKAAVHQLYSDETAIRDALLSSEDPDEHDVLLPASLIFQKSRRALGSISSEEWAALLHKHIGAGCPFQTPDPMILVVSKQRLVKLAGLLGALPPARLLNVVGWTLAYTYAWILNPNLDTFAVKAKNQAPAARDLNARILCFLGVHESYGISQTAPLFHDAFPAYERNQVEAVLTQTAETIAYLLNASSVISNDTKAQAATKLTAHGSLRLWPEEPFMHAEVFDLLYSQFPLESESFFAAWLNSRKALRAALSNRYHESLMLARYRWQHRRVLYLYSLNVMRLGMAALFPPSYHRRGSRAMTYAGLGFQLARQLLRFIDERGRTLDYAGRPLSWWKQNPGSTCGSIASQDPHERRAAADLLALNVAMTAMQRAALADSSPLRLKSLQAMNDAQTFYVSYCSHFCDEEPTTSRSICNLAMNSSGFGSAFGCEAPAASGVSTPQCLFV